MDDVEIRLAQLEVRHDERHDQVMSMLAAMGSSNAKLADVVERLSEQIHKQTAVIEKVAVQEKEISDHAVKLGQLESRQQVLMWLAGTAVGGVISVISVGLKLLLGS